MSFKEGSMKAHGAAHVTLTITPPLAPHNEQGQKSPSSPPAHGNSFVKSIDRKARSYLKTFERSFSFTGSESRDEDPSSMTIEFLKTRLQAQRAEYKAEKHKAQQLAKKVLELEQRLNSEIERRKMAEHNDVLVSPKYSTTLRSFRSFNDRIELAITDSKFRESSCGEEHSDCCSEISSSEDGVFLISPSSLRHRSQVLGREHQRMTNQHEYVPAKDTNEDSIMERTFEEEQRNKPYGVSKCASPLGAKLNEDLENMNTPSDTWSTKDDKDEQPSEVVTTFEDLTLRHEEPPIAGQPGFQNQPHGQSCTFSKVDNNITSERPYCKYVTEEMRHQSIHYLVKPTSCQDCPNHTSLADGMIFDDLSSQKGVRAEISRTPCKAESISDYGITGKIGFFKDTSTGQNQTHEYIFAHSNRKKDETRQGYTLRHVTNSEYVKAILPLDMIRSLDNYEVSLLRLDPEKFTYPRKKTSPNSYSFSSPMQSHQRGRLRQYRKSLDGGLDRLQEVRHNDRQGRQSMS